MIHPKLHSWAQHLKFMIPNYWETYFISFQKQEKYKDDEPSEKYKDDELSAIDFFTEMYCGKKKGFTENV
jgi:hypothetical protein